MSGRYLVGVWKVSEKCLEGVNFLYLTFSGPKFWGLQVFRDPSFLVHKIFSGTQNFSGQIFFGTKIFSGPKFFRDPKLFWTQIFIDLYFLGIQAFSGHILGPKTFLDLNFFGTLIF